ncbi:GIN domain-containing protein [Flammeovirga pacifica]|uniref:Putative auto-transporter adhesin head GIN domain-containing protein n=1 Tax=Flammeovirga pacifica TaxID=915059 RepID=A0A1S1Z0Y7_FLAPC|nr:DUF2807 domain-containing protein [Flammeovirga pacifica]OHX66765.1 hypothetical protein NH26_10560 [Flammeovirga pacifica]
MKKSFIYITILTILAALTSCSNDDLNGILMPKFKKIEVADNVHVIYRKKDIQNFDVDGRHNLDDYYEVRNETLYLKNNNHDDVVTIEVGSPDIESIVVKNSATLEFANDFETYADNFKLYVYNAGQVVSVGHFKVETFDVEVRNSARAAFNNIEVNHLNVEQEGGTSLFVEGFARYQDLSVHNGAFFNEFRTSEHLDWFRDPNAFKTPVRGEEVDVNLQGGVSAYVYPETKLSGVVNGGSHLYYKGDVDISHVSASSGNSIDKK